MERTRESNYMIQAVRVISKKNTSQEKKVLLTLKKYLPKIQEIKLVKVYRLNNISRSEAKILSEKLFSEKITHRFSINKKIITSDKSFEISYRPGVMNPEIQSIIKSSSDIGIKLSNVQSSLEYHFFGKISTGDINKLIEESNLYNPTIENIVVGKYSFDLKRKFLNTRIIRIRELNEDDLISLSMHRHLFLNLDEMSEIQKYFTQIERDPTDCELEILAQSWSEHCVHKTFKSNLIVDGKKKDPLFMRIKSTNRKNDSRILSAFNDNSGVIDFYNGYGICGKVETHNSPSAIEPYGGAMTGSGGVFRDIAGTGKGAKVLVSTDMFCLAPYNLPSNRVPDGCLEPRYLMERVVSGVRDYGNRVGIPTNNGSFHFHKDFRAKPTIAVGAYGIIKKKYIKKDKLKSSDLVITLGGRTGKDGIHGATFSSAEMKSSTKDDLSTAVQIGNAIEEKRLLDAIIILTEKNLIKSITDCGAGGFSSAIGEMAKDNGVIVQLDKVPLKYIGLSPWEIFLSESQERMVIAIDRKNLRTVKELCKLYNVEAVSIGEISNDSCLKIYYKKDNICNLPMNFIHDGFPKRTLLGKTQKPKLSKSNPKKLKLEKIINKVLSHPNVCSKEQVIRLYDHNVMGNNALHPLTGKNFKSPNNSSIIRPFLDKKYGLITSHGLNPNLNSIDIYNGSIWAATEAVSNYISVGGKINDAALIDNFIFPYPDQATIAQLDASVDALVKFSKFFDIPFVSGKDSLSGTFKFSDGRQLKIPPVILVSVFGKIQDVSKTTSSDFKSSDSLIVLIGNPDKSLGGSLYNEIRSATSYDIPKVDFNTTKNVFIKIPKLINSGIIKSCHDISEGGLIVALSEMSFGSNIGQSIVISNKNLSAGIEELFNETPGRFVIEVDKKDLPKLVDLPHRVIGSTNNSDEIIIFNNKKQIYSNKISHLKKTWEKPFLNIF